MLRSLLGRVEERAITTGSLAWGDWPGDGGSSTWSGSRVDAHSSLQLLTVYGCVRLISDSISTLPVDCYRRSGDDKIEITAPDWLVQPTVDLDFAAWCAQVLASLLLHGNAYIAVLRNIDNRIVELVPLDPVKVQVRREGGRKVFYVNGVRLGEVVHIAGLMLPGSDVGLSPVECARQSIGLGLATQEYGARFFAEGANMPGVITIPGAPPPEKQREIADSWRRKRSRGNSGLPGILTAGATWTATGVTNEQAQFLLTRNFTAAEIAGQMFMVDPTDLGIGVTGQSLTYANLEQRNTRRVQVTFLPWIVRLEAAISGLLLRPRYIKLNVNGLLRGDQQTRYESYAVGIRSQFLTPPEVRAWEEMPPINPADVVKLPEPPKVVPDVPAA